MGGGRFAALPKPPYYTVIFSSIRRDGDSHDYDTTAERMVALAAAQPGFLGVESARDGEGFGITVSYWDSEAAIAAWKRVAEHAAARERGRRDWYAGFEVRVAKVERAYGRSSAQDEAVPQQAAAEPAGRSVRS